MYLNENKMYVMRKSEKSVLLASGIGLVVAFGFWALKKLISKHPEYNPYNDFQHLFSNQDFSEEHHGVEYYSVR